jgi:hypothetical protein
MVHLVQFESQWRHVRVKDLAEDAPQLGQGILGDPSQKIYKEIQAEFLVILCTCI